MFYIVDWSWYLFRSYYAMPDLKNSDWESIWAIYWFFRMLIKLLQEKPEKFVIAWDSWWKTVRHDQYKEYKANRPKIPNEFKNQIEVIKDIIVKLNIPFIWIKWYEADDIIFSLAKKANWLVRIVSSDKDLKQLLCDTITFYDPVKQVNETSIDFFTKMWFQPINIVDYLSLLWDASDNIPWVKWIWKKTAELLIKEFSTIENIYENIDKISWSVKNKLIEWKEFAFKSKELINLILIDEVDPLKIDNHKIDFDLMKNILIEEYWFKSMEKMIDNLKLSYNVWIQTSLF